MSNTNRKSIIQIIYNILVIVLSSIFSGLGYGFLAAGMGVNSFGLLFEQMLFGYFVGGLVSILLLGKLISKLKIIGGSILVAIFTTIVISIAQYDLIYWFGNFVWNLSGDSILGSFLITSIISILVFGLKILFVVYFGKARS